MNELIKHYENYLMRPLKPIELKVLEEAYQKSQEKKDENNRNI